MKDYKNLDSTLIGRITLFFLTTSIYIIEMVLTIPTENYIRLLNDMVNNKFLLMQVSFIAFEIYLILVIIFFYFNKINKFCKQIFLLRKIFNIFKS